MARIGKNIMDRRKEIGMTQEELAQKMGYKSKSSINKIELGKSDIPHSKIESFAEALGTTPGDLMGWETVQSNNAFEGSKGDRIKKLRESKGMTQDELAQLLKTKRQTISKYEKGIVANIPSERLEEIANILETTPEYILGWKKTPKSNDALYEKLSNEPAFYELVNALCNLNAKQIAGIKLMLDSFLN